MAARASDGAVRVVLRLAREGATRDVVVDALDRRSTIGEVKRLGMADAGFAEAVGSASDAVVIYGGRVLGDDETVWETIAKTTRGVARYGVDGGRSAGASGAGTTMDDDGVEEYVLHVVIRRAPEETGGGGPTSAEAKTTDDDPGAAGDERSGGATGADAAARRDGANGANASPSTSSRDDARGRRDAEDGRPGFDARDPGTPSVFANAVPPTPASTPTSAFAPRVSALNLAVSPLINATYQAAYHAAFAALSPGGAATSPGPPPLGEFSDFLATDPRGDGDGRVVAMDRRRADARVDHGLPPELNIPPGARVRVVHIRIDLKLILKLIAMTLFLSQDASAPKVMLYVALAVFVYLQQTGALNPLARRLAGENADRNGQNGEPGREGAREDGGANGNGENGQNNRVFVRTRATHAAGYTAMPQSALGEVKIFLYSFVASIFPSWLPPRLHEVRDERPHRD
ncbi:unnamed product [Ostreococcus tauri]|uniref:Unnamed product n=2 Tax=Ostreococcus tauri TaxID=70448 RepID=A0A090M4N9_OSTTA|nr:unnamed product [Ostreococcus tauri]CEF99156.1 unnamed product [Ostreococcus tauri]|eukprot:XP_003081329.2 unnamed product [Ostreococcus tauri]